VNAIIVQKQPYRRMVRTLREFEGWRCLWRVPTSAALFVAVPLFLIGITVAATAIAGDSFDVDPALVAAIVGVGGSSYVYPRLARRELHRKLIADRLWTWEKPNPATHVQILLRDADVDDAKRRLRRAGFNPGTFMTRVGSPPSDAPELEVQVGVEEPEAHIQSSSDEDQVRRMADALDTARIRARVAGVDVPRSEDAAPASA
jgi:hypothetical protein